MVQRVLQHTPQSKLLATLTLQVMLTLTHVLMLILIFTLIRVLIQPSPRNLAMVATLRRLVMTPLLTLRRTRAPRLREPTLSSITMRRVMYPSSTH